MERARLLLGIVAAGLDEMGLVGGFDYPRLVLLLLGPVRVRA